MFKLKKIKINVNNTKINIIIAWCVVFLFFLLLLWGEGLLFSIIHASFVTATLILMSFIESKILVKYFLERKKVAMFYFLNFILVLGTAWISVFFEFNMVSIMKNFLPYELPQPKNAPEKFVVPYLIRLILFTAVVAVSVITNLQISDREKSRIMNELKSEKLDMELRYLKSQINPHFLFNALNNIYSLAYTHDDSAPASVLKLSEMLRYVMVDCQADNISIEKEVKYIENYIDFQLLRIEGDANVKFDKKIENYGFKMPPMILQPIIENSFKHSRLENDPDGYVCFSLEQTGCYLTFVSENSVKSNFIVPSGAQVKKVDSNIGLQNVKRRLNLYYGNDYSFEIKNNDNKYRVTIVIGGK